MRQGDLSLTVSQRKLRCVLDPSLVLGHSQGMPLAQRLTQVMEPWLTRSFWQTLDASELLLRRSLAEQDPLANAAPLPSPQAMVEWNALRESTDAGSWTLRWVGDRLAESQLQDAGDATLIDRFEQLTENLAIRWERQALPPGYLRGLDTAGVTLDALALAVALDDALVLSARGQRESDAAPWLARAAQRIDIAVDCIDPERHPLLCAERQVVRQALASAGLAPLLTHSLPLAVLHVLPADTAMHPSDAELADPFNQATVWWYPL
jgi:hypothetical protein